MSLEMGYWIQLVAVCLWLHLTCFSFTFGNAVTVGEDEAVKGTVIIDGKSVIGNVDDDFVCATLDWWPPEKCDYGRCSWGLASLFNLDLNNTILLNAVKALSPLKLRLGGSLQDKLIYGTEGNHQPCTPFGKSDSEMFGFTEGCFPMQRWDALNYFFEKARAKIIFGLNALAGKSIQGNSTTGPWNSTNAESFIRYTVGKGYTIYGWELGNELSGVGVGTSVTAEQYASDVAALRNILYNEYGKIEPKPLVIAPGGFYDENWYKEYIGKAGKSMDVVTHHIYNLGPGDDEHLVEKILDPSYLDEAANTFKGLKDILASTGIPATAWVGEAGGAFNSGHHPVSDTFVNSFWYLDQLGMSAAHDTKTYCRQTLIGGNYGLLNTTNFQPNPDYYSALLWHRLMGRNVLSTAFSGTNKIRAYAHCAKQSKGITVLLINLDSNTTVEAEAEATFNNNNNPKSLRHRKLSIQSEVMNLAVASGIAREEYHLTPQGGDIHSQIMLLNGNALSVNSAGDIPPLEPLYVNSSEPIRVDPFSIVFVHLPYAVVAACS
ncbi:hypothetical protein Fmac_020846 [Flemingia macrophylla]|uniref:Heparanase-like protein 3 n=1 Tax=Flemingia macrophylla TaxID=520843 RepID=A0ABD1LV82_9FABA